MSPIEIAALLALTGYAIYRQTQRHEVVGRTRFKMAIIYAVVGLAVGGFSRPDSLAEVLLLVGGLALSVVVPFAIASADHPRPQRDRPADGGPGRAPDRSRLGPDRGRPDRRRRAGRGARR